MTAKAKQDPANEPIRDVSAPADVEFETIVGESATTVIFDTVGESFTGRYVGEEHIDPDNGKDEAFDRFTFRAKDGELYAITKSYKIADALEDVKPDTWVRITYVKDIPTKRGLNPMKDLKVEVAKSK